MNRSLHNVDNQDILAWVDAHDIRYSLDRLSPDAKDAALEAERKDRALVIDTAIRSALHDKLDETADELDAVDDQIATLVGERTLILERNSEIAKVLGEKSLVKSKRFYKKEPETRPVSDEKITPFKLDTQDIPRNGHPPLDSDKSEKEIKYRNFVEFKKMIKSILGSEYTPAVVTHLTIFLSSKKLDLVNPNRANVRKIANTIEFDEEGITFKSDKPEDYLYVAEQAKGIGEITAHALVSFLQKYPKLLEKNLAEI